MGMVSRPGMAWDREVSLLRAARSVFRAPRIVASTSASRWQTEAREGKSFVAVWLNRGETRQMLATVEEGLLGSCGGKRGGGRGGCDCEVGEKVLQDIDPQLCRESGLMGLAACWGIDLG